MNVRGNKRGLYCSAAWGWKGATYCVKGRLLGRFHLGDHRDAEGNLWPKKNRRLR